MIKPRIGGHPIHIMLVHFPTALYTMAVICATIFYFTNDPIPGHVSFYCMAGGMVTGWLTILFGIWEAILAPLQKPRIVTAILWHASLNGTITTFFTVWCVKAWHDYPEPIKDSSLLLIFKWIAIIGLFVGNYFGGQLLLKHRVGLANNDAEK